MNSSPAWDKRKDDDPFRVVVLIFTWIALALILIVAFSMVSVIPTKIEKTAVDMEDFYDDDVNPHIGYGIGMSGKGGVSYDGWVLTEDGIEPGMGF